MAELAQFKGETKAVVSLTASGGPQAVRVQGDGGGNQTIAGGAGFILVTGMSITLTVPVGLTAIAIFACTFSASNGNIAVRIDGHDPPGGGSGRPLPFGGTAVYSSAGQFNPAAAFAVVVGDGASHLFEGVGSGDTLSCTIHNDAAERAPNLVVFCVPTTA